ncbi:MAG: serine/threonine-protein kinase, partial [Planctomycetota bacterium]
MTRVPVSELLDLAPADTSSGDGEERPADRPGQLGRYHVRGELGRGGMGAVLRAFDRDIRREVAVKVMLPGTGDRVARARFLTEGQVTGQLEHPNIVPVHELGLDADGRMFIAMRLVRGRSLRQVLKAAAADPGTFPLVQRLDVFRKVCDAVAFAHSRGVIHRDLKPDNVMVGHFGEVQVMDWGLARLLDAPDPADRAGLAPKDMAPDGVEVDDDGTARTLDGQIVGTPAYMPPEQVEGDRDAV